MDELWSDVDRYIEERLLPVDPALVAAQERAMAGGLPAIAVSAPQGAFLHLLTRICGARRVLELGTLGGYSTIWLGRALPPDGTLLSRELNPENARVAQSSVEAAGLGDRVEIVVGPALESLAELPPDEPFDLIFLDADKVSMAAYFEWALRLAHPGTVIVADNIVRGGRVAGRGSEDPTIRGVRAFFDLVHETPGVVATALQTVGSKGYDGFAVALVTGAEPAQP